MLTVILIVMVVGVAFCLVSQIFALKAFRRLVDFQFLHYNDAWIADGKPKGGKITRSRLSFFGSDFASVFCAMRWTISRPNWLSPGSVADKFRLDMIRWFFILIIGFFVWLVVWVSLLSVFE